MKLRLLIFFPIIITLAISHLSCNAPRNNPLDPFNPDYNFGTIEGVVQSSGPARFGISGVSVLWTKNNLIASTDANGRFNLQNVPVEDGYLMFYKQGYKPDTLFVAWGSNKRIFSNVFFNRIPTLDSISIYSVMKNDFDETEAELVFNALLTDHDRDLDSVFIYSEEMNLKKPMGILSEGLYQLVLTDNELNIDIEQTIGKDFSIIVQDDNLNEFTIGAEHVTRIIKNVVTGMHPSTDSSVTSQTVILRWDRLRPGYNFTFSIEVVKRIGLINQQVVHTTSGIPSDSVSYTLPLELTPGEYYWVIWIVDQFQNRARSIPAGFRIESSGKL